MDEIKATFKNCPDSSVATVLDFCPRGPGFKSPQGHTLFFSCYFYIFEKIRVSTSFFGAFRATESNKKIVDPILSILGGH